jgi:hypothetical protein
MNFSAWKKNLREIFYSAQKIMGDKTSLIAASEWQNINSDFC